MVGGERGDLGKMSDAQDLVAGGERSCRRGDEFGRLAADPGVDFIEDQGVWRGRVFSRAADLRASMIRDSFPEAIFRSGLGGSPRLGEMRNSTSSKPAPDRVGLVRGKGRPSRRTSEAGVLHPEQGDLFFDQGRQLAGGRPAGL